MILPGNSPSTVGRDEDASRRDFLKIGLGGLSGIALAGAGLALSAEELRHVRDIAMPVTQREWVRGAVKRMWQERLRSGITPLVRLDPSFKTQVRVYVKHEAKSPTGSLKHRVAWGLIMAALVNGQITKDTHLYETSSGNTAIGEAYFATLLGLPFTAVMKKSASALKIKAIQQYGGQVAFSPDGMDSGEYLRELLAKDTKGYNIRQFANTEKVLDYFDADADKSMNMAAEVYRQMAMEPEICPAYFVSGAGSGGTATSIARYFRKWADFGSRSCPAQLVLADPDGSALSEWCRTGDSTLKTPGSRIDGVGIGGPLVFGQTISLLREGVSRAIQVPDRATIAGMRFISELLNYKVGPSTGVNVIATMHLVDEMTREGRSGAVVTIINDDGSRYADTYYNQDWLKAKSMEPQGWTACVEEFWKTGKWNEPA